jgi:signal transduction histidine kinase
MSLGDRPIFHRLLLAFFLVGLAVSGPLIYLSYELNRGSTEHRIQQNMLQQLDILAVHFVEDLAARLHRTLKVIESSPNLDALLSMDSDGQLVLGKRLETDFVRIANDHDRFSGIYFVDADGAVQVGVEDRRRNALAGFEIAGAGAGAAAMLSPTQAAMTRLFAHVRATPTLLSSGNMEWFMPPREPYIVGPFVDEAGRLSLLAGLGKADADNGSFGGMIVIRQRLDQFIAQIKQVRFFDEDVVWLLGPEGRVLARPDSAQDARAPFDRLPVKLEDRSRLRMVDGAMIAYRDLAVVSDQPLLRIAFVVPSSVLEKDLRPTISILLVALATSMAFVLVTAYFVSCRFSRPIIELAAAASRLAAGDLSTRVNVQTAGELRVLVDSFNRMTASLEEASDQQRRFVSIAAHEFRTPLAIIDGAAQRMKRFADRGMAGEIHDRADRIRGAVARMALLIDTTLDSARLEEGRMELNAQPLDLIALVVGVCKRYESVAPDFVFEIAAGSNTLEIVGDPRLLDHAITNLLSNAVKYSGDSRRVDIRIGSDAGRARIAVRDYGIGIDAADLPKLFGRYFRADNAKGLSGTGIGLNLVRGLVELHGGTVRAESTLGKGSTFTVELPIPDASGTPEDARAPIASSANQAPVRRAS